jgi:hypothetical protein
MSSRSAISGAGCSLSERLDPNIAMRLIPTLVAKEPLPDLEAEFGVQLQPRLNQPQVSAHAMRAQAQTSIVHVGHLLPSQGQQSVTLDVSRSARRAEHSPAPSVLGVPVHGRQPNERPCSISTRAIAALSSASALSSMSSSRPRASTRRLLASSKVISPAGSASSARTMT